MTVGRQKAVIRIGYPAWDMYRPREVRDRAGTGWEEQHPESRAVPVESSVEWSSDMYSSGVTKPTAGDRAAVAADPLASTSRESRRARRFWCTGNGSPVETAASREATEFFETGATDSRAVFGG
jgi:hypothetical protein